MANQPKTMQDLPEAVVDFLNGLEGFEYISHFIKKFGLKPEQDIEVINLVLDTVLGQVVFADLPEEIEVLFGFDAEQAKQAAIELAGHRLLPISGVIGNVAEQIKNWGGDLEQFKSQGTVVMPELTAESFVQGALKDLGVAMENEVLQHRLELVLVSYAKGVRDQSEALGTMTRAQKVGGLDMAQEDAEVLLKEIDQKMAFINISFKEKVGREEVGRVKVQDVKPPVRQVRNDKMMVGKEQTRVGSDLTKKKNKRDPEIEKMLATLKADQEKSKALLSQLKNQKVRNEQTQVGNVLTKKKDPEIEKMLATLKADREKSRELLKQLKNQKIKNEQKQVGNEKMRVGNKDTIKTAKKDLIVENEALARNNGAPTAAVKAEVKKPVKLAPKKPNKKSVDTSILNKKAKTGLGADVFDDEDEAEVQRIASVRAKSLAGANDPIQALIEQIIGTAKLKFSDEEIKQRFIKAVESRIRDVRDIYEVRAQLESSKDQGGVGLAGAQLAETVQVIDRLVNEHQTKLQAESEKKQHESMAQKRAQTAQAALAAKQLADQLMAKRYAEITGRAPSEAVIGSVTGSNSAGSAEATLARQEQQIDAHQVKQAVMGAQRIAPKTAKLSASSIMAAAGAKPQVQDVRFTRRLAGPVEELRNMTIVEFRRLSTDPQAASEKIKDKIALVEDQGYEQKIAAIKGWRSSPINQAYLSLSREALLSGKRISDLLKEKGEGSLTEAELVAIMKLNGELHF
ncbi:hypothetical protein KJ611_03740 [Patescibacteria group bacterium]|nr:hypothetical protein [Patescibacteria group bacterium]MBU1705731.1 hypothetical protein [Patescibacteria group bacterium]